MEPVKKETQIKSNIPYRRVDRPFRFCHIVPGDDSVELMQDENGVIYIMAKGGSVANLQAGDNISIEQSEDGTTVISSVDTAERIVGGQNVEINVDPETGDAVISVASGASDEHYKGVFNNTLELIESDPEPETGDYGMIRELKYTDGGDTVWTGKFKYCFYIDGAWQVVDQMLTFTNDPNLIKKFYSVGGSSPVIYLHPVSFTGSFDDLSDKPIVATPEVDVREIGGSLYITVTCETEGADIYYTSGPFGYVPMPTVASSKYEGTITGEPQVSYRFVAVKNGMINSQEAFVNSEYGMQPPVVTLDWRTGEVTMENPNLSGDIWYTTNPELNPVEDGYHYDGPFVITESTYFKAVVTGTEDSGATIAVFDKVKTPNLTSRSENWITGTMSVILSCATPSAEIHYTNDGTNPDYSSDLYGSSIPGRIYEPVTVKAMGFAPGYVPSGVATVEAGYEKPSTPDISYNADTDIVTFTKTGETQNINSSSASKIYYTTDGSRPSADNGTLYTGPFRLPAYGVEIGVVFLAYNEYYSDVAYMEFPAVDAPLIRMSNSGFVYFTFNYPGSKVYYTLDGSTPTRDSAEYGEPFRITEPTTVKAVGYAPVLPYLSPVSEQYFTQYSAPVIEVVNGNNRGVNMLTGTYEVIMINPNKEGVIHYSDDGSNPNVGGPSYQSAIPGKLFAGEKNFKASVFDSEIFTDTINSPVSSLKVGFDAPDFPVLDYDEETRILKMSLGGNTSEIPLQTNMILPEYGARIFYTLDGTSPTGQNGTLWDGRPIQLPERFDEFRAVTICYGMYRSEESDIVNKPSAPSISYDDTAMTAEINLTGDSAHDHTAVIYYTVDGTTPTKGSRPVEPGDTIQLNKGDLLKAITVTENHYTSTVAVQNVYVPESELTDDDVAIVVKNLKTGNLRYAPYANCDASALSSEDYATKEFVRFTRGKNGKPVFMHKDQTSGLWAEFSRYRLACDTSAPGGFDWAVTINGAAKSGSVSWQAGDTLDSILSQLTPYGVNTYLAFSHVEDEQFIRITKGGYSDSTFTLSNNTGGTLTDLSLYTRIGSVQQTEEHRDWQAMNVDAMFPSLGFLAANTVQYAVNGYNLSYTCGGNETKYKEYYRTNGASSYLAENAISGRMSEAAFNAMDGSGNVDAQALYDKYNGDWDAYMEASMVAIDDANANGIEYQSYDNGDDQTLALASVTTMDFDGSYIPAFPCAAHVQSITDTDVTNGKFNMNTEHELVVFMRDAKIDAINSAFDVLIAAGLTATKISRTAYYYWSVSRYSSGHAWLYRPVNGILTRNYLYNGLSARALAYPVAQP